MKFISNLNGIDNHCFYILNGISDASEIFISVAFLKRSGLKLIKESLDLFLKRGGSIQFIVGLSYRLTEPEAIEELWAIIKEYPTSNLYLTSLKKSDPIFHPKLYVFNNNDKATIISGSANLTRGGLTSNCESSIMIKCDKLDNFYSDTCSFLNNILKADYCEKVNLLSILQYKTDYLKQKNLWKDIQALPDSTDLLTQFNYQNLLHFYKDFLVKEDQNQKFEERTDGYLEARLILDIICDTPNLTKDKFIPLLEKLVRGKGQNGLWHSGSIYRKKTTVFNHFKEFQNLVKFIRANKNQKPSYVFDHSKMLVKSIEGSGVNTITEIMMTYNFSDFANLNKNPITVLIKEGNVNLKASRNSFNGQDYEQYCELVKEISRHLGLRSMLEADSFFNDIYQKIKK